MLTLTAAAIKPNAWKTVDLEDQIDFQLNKNSRLLLKNEATLSA